MVSSLPELVGVLLFLWFRKVFSVQVGGAWHPALVFRRSLAWAETETATGNPWVVDFGGRRILEKDLG